MKRQRLRKLLLIVSLLLFPITLYYFSPALIINAGLKGIINGSFIVFMLMFVLSIPFGRLFCAYICPAGGLQECAFLVNENLPRQGWRNYIKYIIWTIWLSAVTYCYFQYGESVKMDFYLKQKMVFLFLLSKVTSSIMELYVWFLYHLSYAVREFSVITFVGWLHLWCWERSFVNFCIYREYILKLKRKTSVFLAVYVIRVALWELML